MLAPRPPRPRGLGTADQALTLPLPSQDTGQPPSLSVVTFFLLTGDDTINLSSVSLQLDRVSPGRLCLSSALGTSPGRLITAPTPPPPSGPPVTRSCRTIRFPRSGLTFAVTVQLLAAGSSPAQASWLPP